MGDVQAFGPHLVLDGAGCDPCAIGSHECLYFFLEEMPHLIGMTPISTPFIARFRGEPPYGEGLSGFVLIAESHVSFHSWPEHGTINIDVFSCRSFDRVLPLQLSVDCFGIRALRMRQYNRGIEWGSCEVRAMEYLLNQRAGGDKW